MRTRKAWLALVPALLLTGLATWSLTGAQEATSPPATQPAPAAKSPVVPASNVQGPASASSPIVPVAAEGPRPTLAVDLAKLSPLQQQMALSVQRGADWLCRANREDGRFVYGYLPAVSLVMEGDHYLRQAGAAFALARAARFTRDPKQLARAQQAVLALLGDTSLDPKDPRVRCTSLPPTVVNRLAAAGLLVLAVHELPAVEKDLLDQAEQLCLYIARQQRTDGSLCYGDDPRDPKRAGEDAEGVNYYPGEALYGLMLSQKHRPAPWKLDVVRKAVVYYHAWWKDHKHMAFVPWQTAAATEAYLLTKEQAFADFVFDMNDWLCALQYEQLDPRHPLWVGGFKSWGDDRPVATPPQVSSASYAEGLAEACRVARAAADVSRHRRYSECLERCLQFLTTLQYSEANTLHFAKWYRERLVGGFHASDQDGNLRIDYTQHALSAMIQYLTEVVR